MLTTRRAHQLNLFSRNWVDLPAYPVRVRAGWSALLAAVLNRQVADGSFIGGRLPGAATWSNRRWASEADISRQTANRLVAHRLCRWDGDDLVLVAYGGTQADERAAASARARDSAMRRWHPDQGALPLESGPPGTLNPPGVPAGHSDRFPDRLTDRFVGSKPAESAKNGSCDGHARARARVYPQLTIEGSGDLDPSGGALASPPAIPPIPGQGPEVGGWVGLPDGAARTWLHYPDTKLDVRYLQPFLDEWQRQQLEAHADQVLALLDRFKASGQWFDSRYIPLPHNWLDRKVKAQLRRVWRPGCACGFCRTNVPPLAVVQGQAIKTPPAPPALTPITEEQAAEMRQAARGLRWAGRDAT